MKTIVLFILVSFSIIFIISCNNIDEPTSNNSLNQIDEELQKENIIYSSSFKFGKADGKDIKWIVRDGSGGPPKEGNYWKSSNVRKDEDGVHLRITKDQNNGNKYYCAQISTEQTFGFGTYQFQVEGQVDNLPKKVVLGLFSYLGPDGANEIDIEFWGTKRYSNGNKGGSREGSYNVWPTKTNYSNHNKFFNVSLNGTYTTHRYKWESKKVYFQSLHGHTNGNKNEIYDWPYPNSKNYKKYIPQKQMPIVINLWLEEDINNKTPDPDFLYYEILIKDFKFTKL
jgi:hypothetical protein